MSKWSLGSDSLCALPIPTKLDVLGQIPTIPKGLGFSSVIDDDSRLYFMVWGQE